MSIPSELNLQEKETPGMNPYLWLKIMSGVVNSLIKTHQ